MPTILVTNNDGVHAPSRLALKQELSRIAEVIGLAPERNWSAVGHAKTLPNPMRTHDVIRADGAAAYHCRGRTTDCGALAVEGTLEQKPDLVVSGINSSDR